MIESIYLFIYKETSYAVVKLLQPLFKQLTQHKNTTTTHSLTYRLLIYTKIHINYCHFLQYLFGNLFIYLDRVQIVILIYTHKYKFNTVIDLSQYLFGD